MNGYDYDAGTSGAPYVKPEMETTAVEKPPIIPSITQQEILFIDGMPDENYVLRILQAYRENCNCKFVSVPPNPLWDLMNQHQDERSKLLDAAIAKLVGAGNPTMFVDSRLVQLRSLNTKDRWCVSLKTPKGYGFVGDFDEAELRKLFTLLLDKNDGPPDMETKIGFVVQEIDQKKSQSLMW